MHKTEVSFELCTSGLVHLIYLLSGPLCLWFVWMTFGDVTELSQSCIMNYDIGAIGEVNYVLYVMRNLTIVGFFLV